MPNDPLSVMVRNLRSECGHSLSIAQGVNSIDTLKYLLARTQRELWTAFTWPDLTIRQDTSLAAGQYIYPFPASFTFDQVRETWACRSDDNTWHQVVYGIEEDKIKPGGENSWRADEVQNWDVEGGSTVQFRVWPTPDTAGGSLRFKGNKALTAFAVDADVSTLDSDVIVLFTASEILARAKAEDAAGKLQKAQRHLQKILGGKISAKMKVSSLGGGSPDYSKRYMDPLNRSSMSG